MTRYTPGPPGRLVLTGGPGAGKTAGMILLLLAALDRRARLTSDQRDRVPVPVWLTTGGWNPGDRSLQEWAAGTMTRDYPALRARDYGPEGRAPVCSRHGARGIAAGRCTAQG
jgi:hypothetical protein